MKNWNEFLASKQTLSEVAPPPPPPPQRSPLPKPDERFLPIPQSGALDLIKVLQEIYNKIGETESILKTFGTMYSPEEYKDMAKGPCIEAKTKLAEVLKKLRETYR